MRQEQLRRSRALLLLLRGGGRRSGALGRWNLVPLGTAMGLSISTAVRVRFMLLGRCAPMEPVMLPACTLSKARRAPIRTLCWFGRSVLCMEFYFHGFSIVSEESELAVCLVRIRSCWWLYEALGCIAVLFSTKITREGGISPVSCLLRGNNMISIPQLDFTCMCLFLSVESCWG